MATYKIDVIQKLGKFHMALWEATGAKKDPAGNPPHDSVNDVLKRISSEIEDRNLVDGKDAIIFRGIAYDDFAMLTREVSKATY